MARKKPQPATRSGSFSEKDYRNEERALRAYWEKEVGFSIRLFRMDTVKSMTKNLYGETKSKDKKFLPAVSLTPSFNIGKSTNKFLSGSGIGKEQYETFEFNLFISEMEEKGVVINKGDFVLFNDGQAIRPFEISTASQINTSNTIGGFRPFYRSFNAVLVSDDKVPPELA